MVKLLHLETATKVCSVALSENGKLVAIEEERSTQYIHAEKLTVFIKNVCDRLGWNLEDLDGISVSSGPGSYTGLRIGVSTAKGLCYALNLPLIAVDSVLSLAKIAHEKYPKSNVCAMIDARRMEVFSAIYDAQFNELKPISADILEENSYAEFESFVVVGDATEKVANFWKNRAIIVDYSILSSAKGQIEEAFQKFQKNKFEDVAYFTPKYLKDFVTGNPKGKT